MKPDHAIDWVVYAVLAVLVVVPMLLGIGWLFGSLWNWIGPLFWPGAPILSFWEGFGAFWLVRLCCGFGGTWGKQK